MFDAQIDPKSISNKVGASFCTVCNAKKSVDMGNSIQKKPDSGIANKKQNWYFINAPKTKSAKNQTTSMWKIVAKLKVDTRSSGQL